MLNKSLTQGFPMREPWTPLSRRCWAAVFGPNFFECELKFPNIGIDDNDVSDKLRFLVKGANLPASNIAPISVPFRGRELKIAGERTFDTWTVTVINDSNFTSA